jgi:hypothetical protein
MRMVVVLAVLCLARPVWGQKPIWLDKKAKIELHRIVLSGYITPNFVNTFGDPTPGHGLKIRDGRDNECVDGTSLKNALMSQLDSTGFVFVEEPAFLQRFSCPRPPREVLLGRHDDAEVSAGRAAVLSVNIDGDSEEGLSSAATNAEAKMQMDASLEQQLPNGKKKILWKSTGSTTFTVKLSGNPQRPSAAPGIVLNPLSGTPVYYEFDKEDLRSKAQSELKSCMLMLFKDFPRYVSVGR